MLSLPAALLRRGAPGALPRFFNAANVIGRGISSTRPCLGIEEFLEPGKRPGEVPPTGRAWTAAELRQKSFSDLHKLWFVLYKEKNLLLTQQNLARRRDMDFDGAGRSKKVQRSMGAIRQVLGERKRVKDAIKAKKRAEAEAAAAAADEDAVA